MDSKEKVRFNRVKVPNAVDPRGFVAVRFSRVFNRLHTPFAMVKDEAVDGQGRAIVAKIPCSCVAKGGHFID
jgi:hypothetical protein